MQKSSIIGFSRGQKNNGALQVINPATGCILPDTYVPASDHEVARACELADLAKLDMALLSGVQKGEFLRTLANQIDDAVDSIVGIATLETALPEGRIRGETARTSGQLRMFAKLVEEGSWVDARIDPAIPDRSPLPKPDLRAMLRPIGPVAVFCASNFPLAFSVAGGDSASAWAAGCPVVVKAHHAHPGTALLIGEIISQSVKDCGLPEGAFSLLFGDGRTVGQGVVRHPAIKAIGFTGSRSGGRAIFDLASQRTEPIPVFAEMSSINPVFLLPDTEKSEMEQIAEGLFTSATLGVGQFCTNPGVVFYPNSVAGEFFRKAFVKKMKTFVPAPMLHKGIRDSYLENFEMMAKLEGVEVLCGSENVLGPKTCHAGSTVLATGVSNFLQVPELKNEIFGPATMLVSYKNDDDLEKVITQLEGQLTASLFGSEKSLSVHRRLVEILETKAGRLLFNQFPTGVEVCESIVHGGPYPATTDSRSTSVGTGAILRFARPVCYQGFPDDFLPEELRRDNPLGLDRKEV